MKTPDIDLSDCTMCGICVDLCPDTFRVNDAGYIEVLPSDDCSEEDIEEAIKTCRGNCIFWKHST